MGISGCRIIGWFELLYTAEHRELENFGFPMEIFHNNSKTEEYPTT